MAFLRNRAVNFLNLHYGLHALALTGGGAFYGVYLLKAGLCAPQVLVALALILLGRFFVRPLIIPLAARTGIRPLLILGTLLVTLQYPLLARVSGIGPPLYVLCVVSSLGDTIYWSCYHAFFAALGDPAHRGHQVSAREALVAVCGIASPLLTGWMLVRYGAVAAFGVTSLFLLLSLVPLFYTPNVAVPAHVSGSLKAARTGVLLFSLDGFISSGLVFTWQIALFVTLRESYLDYGGALALAALAGAVAGLLLGRHIDAGGGGRAVPLALGVFACVLLLRAASPGHAALAVTANALSAAANCLYIPTLMTAVYNESKRSPDTLRFHVATEGGWDFGGGGGALLAALLLHEGASFRTALLLPLIGVAALAWGLSRYYAVRKEISVSP